MTHILPMATVCGLHCFFLSEFLIDWLLFEGGIYSKESSITQGARGMSNIVGVSLSKQSRPASARNKDKLILLL